jgi:N6-adenosine-specific RNA methylase IME4
MAGGQSQQSTSSQNIEPQVKGKKKLAQSKLSKLEQKPRAFKGLDIKQLMQLQIPDSVMREGILFIWVEKELISDLLDHFETQGFQYVENVSYVMLDESKRKGKSLSEICCKTHF